MEALATSPHRSSKYECSVLCSIGEGLLPGGGGAVGAGGRRGGGVPVGVEAQLPVVWAETSGQEEHPLLPAQLTVQNCARLPQRYE